MDVNWNCSGMLMWKEEAVKEQQDYFDLLGTPIWREFKPSDYGNLKREIGFALFNVPEEEPCAYLNDGTGYTHKKLKHINRIFDIIKKCMENHRNTKNILVSFLFVSGKTRDDRITYPVIRIPQFDITFKQNINLFIDSCGRVYEEWQDYLENNTIPECVLCYPRNGVYSAVNGAVEVEFGISPAGRTGTKVLQRLDIGGTVLSVGAVGALIAGLFLPVAFPVVAGAVGVSTLTGVYAAGRNIQTLVDRSQHQQTIGLSSAESRNCWLGIGGGMMSVVSGGTVAAAAKTAQAATTIPLAGQIAIKSVAVSSCVLNGLAVSNGLANIIIKARNEEKITGLDVFQFTSAVLFFTHSVISTRQAVSVINSMGQNSSGGSAGIKAFMNRISEFMGQTKICDSVPCVIVGCSPPVLTTAGGTESSLLSVCRVVGRKLIEITKILMRGLTNMYNYMSEVGELLGQFWESWNKEMTEVCNTICKAFGVRHWSELIIKGYRHFEFGHIRAMASTVIAEKRSLVDCGSTAVLSDQGRAIYENSGVVGTDDGSDSLADGEAHTCVSYYDEMANIHSKFVEQQMCRNPADLCRYMIFICKFVKSQLEERKKRYEKSWEMLKRFNPDVKIEDFKKEYGVSGNPNNHFLQEVFNEYKNEEADVFTLLHLAYEKQNAGTSAQEEHGQSFLDEDGVRFHPFYSMQGLAGSGMLSKQQYCEMAAKLTGHFADTESIYLSDSGDTAVVQLNAAAYVVMVWCRPEDGKVSGIAAVLYTPSD